MPEAEGRLGAGLLGQGRLGRSCLGMQGRLRVQGRLGRGAVKERQRFEAGKDYCLTGNAEGMLEFASLHRRPDGYRRPVGRRPGGWHASQVAFEAGENAVSEMPKRPPGRFDRHLDWH